MKKSLLAAAAAAACLLPLGAHAAATVDVYYVDSPELEVDVDGLGSATFDGGDGYGVKGQFDIAPGIFLTGEYQSDDYEELEGISVDASSDQIRGGLGVYFGAGLPFYARAEIIRMSVEIEGDDGHETGYGLHLGADAKIGDMLSLYGQLGYVDVDGDGLEYLVGAAFMITPSIGAFVDYRDTTLEEDDVELNARDLRFGVRLAVN